MPPSYLQVFERRSAALIEGVLDEEFYFEPSATAYLEGILLEVAAANGIEFSPLLLIERSPTVNAYSMGHGLFVVTTGLLANMPRRDQLVFILAHELAHDQLDHLGDKLAQLPPIPEDAQSERDKRAARRAQRKELKERGQFAMMKDQRDQLYNARRFNRANELEADSMAAVYLQQTKYDVLRAADALANLNPGVAFNITREQTVSALTSAGYPLQEHWLRAKATMFGGSFGKKETEEAEEEYFWAADSLRTHPDIDLRLARLGLDSALARNGASAVDHPLATLAQREQMALYDAAELPIHTICLAIPYLDKPEDPNYLIAQAFVARSLDRIGRSIPEHNYAKMVPPAAHFEAEGAHLLVEMTQRMNAGDLRQLALALAEDAKREFPDSSIFTALLLELRAD
ncbi:M48 family metalloprotease [Lewinella sp. 4G2]|uniref:M48 family metalloprotease n=1 Tax=Lewinella sp. 4G2 TaxID=1803372 RepID=UPI0018D2F1BA|nr:M48 family metalloprotease [Lewinella sp. 4G2]